MGGAPFLPFSLLLFAVAFILLLLDAKFSRQFREFRDENWDQENVTDRLAKSALNRTKTAACRVQLRHFLHEISSKTHWPVEAVENSCRDLFDVADLYSLVGCFRDFPSDRLLGAFSTKFAPQNSSKLCVQFCLRAGFRFAGVEFRGAQCFCGSSDAEFTKRSIARSVCDPSHCVSDSCGDAFTAISVFRTGIRAVPSADNALKFRHFSVDGPKVKILFLLQLNGRDSRQVRRLLRTLFLPHHLYLLHVDSRHEFMLKGAQCQRVEQSLHAKGFANFRVAKRRMATLWGGSTLLDLFLWTVAETLGGTDSQWARWDYMVNLSETDMPILSVEELEQNLDKNRGLSFLKSHGHNTAAFLQRQGLHFHFTQCEQRMWRVAERHNFPDNLRLDGGSDWVLVHRDLALFAISDSVLPSQMRLLFSSVLLPLESFFHTLALNSANFCRRIVSRNLRFTNWRRRQGCRCAALSHAVDWCGCSPLALRADQMEAKLGLNLSQSKLYFFARKFDPFVDIAAIAFAERQSLRFRAHLLPVQSVVFSSHWLSVFSSHSPSDGLPFGLNAKTLTLFASLIVRFVLPINGTFQRLNDVQIYKEFSSATPQTIATFSVGVGRRTNCSIQALIGQKTMRSSVSAYRPNPSTSGNLIVVHGGSRFLFDVAQGIEVGLGFDQKEEIFRTFPPLISSSSTFTLKWHWLRLGIGADGHAKWTSPPAELSLQGPNGLLFQSVSVPPYDSLSGTQFAHFQLGRFSDVLPGHLLMNECVWSVTLHANAPPQNHSLIASVSFPVFPDPSTDSEWGDRLLIGLIADFFFVHDFCAITVDPPKESIAKEPISSLANCSEVPWSNLFFDEKSVFSPTADGHWAGLRSFITDD